MAFAVDFGLRVDEVCLLRLQKLLAAFSSWPSVSQDLMHGLCYLVDNFSASY
jgi:hypothetical protein